MKIIFYHTTSQVGTFSTIQCQHVRRGSHSGSEGGNTSWTSRVRATERVVIWLTYPAGGKGIRGEDKRNPLVGVQGGKLGLETTSVQEGIEGREVFSEVGTSRAPGS